MIGVQAVTGGVIGLVVLAGLSALVVGGIIGAIYFLVHKRYAIGGSVLAASLILGALPVSGWWVVFKPTPERNMAIDFRSQVSSAWTAAMFQSCRPALARPATTECGSNDHINMVRLALPDGAEVAAVAKLVSISFDEGKRLTSVNLVLHPYMEPSAALATHAMLETHLMKGALNSSAAFAKSREVETWLKDGSNQKYVDNYVCFERTGYNLCARYKPPYSGRQYIVTYEIATKQ